MRLYKDDKIALCACSDPLTPQGVQEVHEIIAFLKSIGLNPVCSPLLESAMPIPNERYFQQRAEILQSYFLDSEIKMIFDVSGGNLANTVIDYLDFDIIKAHPKPFCGYSDLTVLLNTFYTQTQNPMILYTIRHLVHAYGAVQRQRFIDSFFEEKNSLFDFKYHFLRGTTAEGIVVGGNIRCFLKLAGTPYFPETQDKILFLESLGGEPYLLQTQLHQFMQMGVFDKISGLLLGTFTNIEKNYSRQTVESIVLDITVDYPFPIISTDELGHASDSKALMIGQRLCL